LKFLKKIAKKKFFTSQTCQLANTTNRRREEEEEEEEEERAFYGRNSERRSARSFDSASLSRSHHEARHAEATIEQTNAATGAEDVRIRSRLLRRIGLVLLLFLVFFFFVVVVL
jgi:SET domain-containing protein